MTKEQVEKLSESGALIVFNPTGDMKPVCLCRECADGMIRYNE